VLPGDHCLVTVTATAVVTTTATAAITLLLLLQVYCTLAKNQHVSETRSMALEEFAQTLDADQTRVVHASKTEWYIEGPYWLVKESERSMLSGMPAAWLHDLMQGCTVG
jgi:hypothetical protein